MNQDDVRRMARETGWDEHHCHFDTRIERFAALVAAHEREVMFSDGWRQCAKGQRTTQFCAETEKVRLEEREECAKVCEDVAAWYPTDIFLEDGKSLDCKSAAMARLTANNCANAIRTRGTE